jgi:hypothetical protein
MKFIKRALIPLFAVIAVIMASCVDGACYEDTESLLSVSFYRGEEATSVQKLSVIGSGMEEFLYSEKSSVAKATIPLDPGAGSVTLYFSINDTTDMVMFNYTSEAYMFSKECGYSWTYYIESVSSTNNIIDKIAITDANITISDEENIRIYY